MLHLADLHLGYKPTFLDDNRAAIRQKERDQILEKVVNFALDPVNSIDIVLIVGDLFETHRPEEKLTRTVMEQLKRLVAAGLFCVTVPGNHDEISYHDSVYRVKKDEWPGVLVQNPMPELVATRETKGTILWIYSLAYTGGLTKVSSLGNYPRDPGEGIHIGAFHGTLDWNPGERSLPLKSGDLAKSGYDYIALGHIHQYQKQKVGAALAVYPGAVESKSLSERGVGHLTVVNFDHGKVDIEKPEVAVRKHEQIELDLSTADNWETLQEKCRNYRDPDKIVEFKLKGTPGFPVNVERLVEELERSFFHISMADESSYVDLAQIEKYTGEHTVRSEFVKRIFTRMNQTEDEREKEILKLALLKGLAAFQRGE
jgi:DNA repair exonuclease SbcCD nuclease subunit